MNLTPQKLPIEGAVRGHLHAAVSWALWSRHRLAKTITNSTPFSGHSRTSSVHAVGRYGMTTAFMPNTTRYHPVHDQILPSSLSNYPIRTTDASLISLSPPVTDANDWGSRNPTPSLLKPRSKLHVVDFDVWTLLNRKTCFLSQDRRTLCHLCMLCWRNVHTGSKNAHSFGLTMSI